MLNRSDGHGLDASAEAARQSLSALVDGQATAADVDALCARWRGDMQVREQWATYHLIGDVLRSEDLASRPARDEAFLQSLRQKLAAEPVPLAPRPAAQAKSGRLRWQAATAAAAAGFVVVAGVLVMTRPDRSDNVSSKMASQGQPELTLASGKLVRDAQLDRYMAAHRRVSNGAVVGIPGAEVRTVGAFAVDDK
jgi:sigma-E factor negative regulatory protein RseA